jgi:hypothetical protein
MSHFIEIDAFVKVLFVPGFSDARCISPCVTEMIAASLPKFYRLYGQSVQRNALEINDLLLASVWIYL